MTALIYGLHAISVLVAQQPHQVLEVFVALGRTDPQMQSLLQRLEEQGIAWQRVSPEWLSRQTAAAKPQLWGTQIPFLLVLDGITDPHNLGACLRSADAAGVHAVIIPKNRAVSYNATVSKVACGAAERVPLVAVTNLARLLRTLQSQGIWVFGTSDQAASLLYQQSLTGPLVLIMGAEEQGLRRLTAAQCDSVVHLPMAGSVSSLNVSVATGICLFEVVRQRSID